jgi:hypothetical protein
MPSTLGICFIETYDQQNMQKGVSLNREEILRKSKAEKRDEGKEYLYAYGRKSGVIGMMGTFIILSVYYLYNGNKEQNFPILTVIFGYLAFESIGIFYITKRKRELVKICIGLLFCLFFLLLSLA